MIHDAHFQRVRHLAVFHDTYMNVLAPKDSCECLRVGGGPLACSRVGTTLEPKKHNTSCNTLLFSERIGNRVF